MQIENTQRQSYGCGMSQKIIQCDEIRIKTLSQELTQISVGGLLSLGLGALWLSAVWGATASLQWLIQSSVLWLFICLQTSRRLKLNRPDQASPLYDQLGWANRLTLLRSWLIAATGGFLFQDWPEGMWLSWLPGMIYFLGAVLDRVDGFMARKTGQISELGNELDTVSDALGLAVAGGLAWSYGQVHVSYLLMGAAYYLFQAGLILRRMLGMAIYPLAPSMHRRAWAGFQMGYLVVTLWPLFYPPVTLVAGFAFMLPALTGFIVDWLVVSGRITVNSDAARRKLDRLILFSHSVLQPGLRLAIATLLAFSLWRVGFPTVVIGGEIWPSLVMLGYFALATIMVVLGIAGRYFCLLLLGLLGWFHISNPMHFMDYLLLCCVVWSMFLGSGRFCLWQEDSHWINRYDGA